MNLEQLWHDIEGNDDGKLEGMLQQKFFLHSSHQRPLAKLKKNTVTSLWLGVAVTILYLALLGVTHEWLVRFALVVLIGYNSFILWSGYGLHKLLNANHGDALPVLSHLRQIAAAFARWRKWQNQVAFFVYPVAAAGGFLFGITLGAGLPLDEVLWRPGIVWWLLGSVLVMSALGYLLGRWWYKLAFGRYAAQIEETIRELEEG
jgi:hypothetical protein